MALHRFGQASVLPIPTGYASDYSGHFASLMGRLWAVSGERGHVSSRQKSRQRGAAQRRWHRTEGLPTAQRSDLQHSSTRRPPLPGVQLSRRRARRPKSSQLLFRSSNPCINASTSCSPHRRPAPTSVTGRPNPLRSAELIYDGLSANNREPIRLFSPRSSSLPPRLHVAASRILEASLVCPPGRHPT